MWAQLMKMRLQPGKDLAVAGGQLRAAEQPGSGMLRTLIMRDQKDPSQAYTLVVFESEEKGACARAGPAPPGRAAGGSGDAGRGTCWSCGVR